MTCFSVGNSQIFSKNRQESIAIAAEAQGSRLEATSRHRAPSSTPLPPSFPLPPPSPQALADAAEANGLDFPPPPDPADDPGFWRSEDRVRAWYRRPREGADGGAAGRPPAPAPPPAPARASLGPPPRPETAAEREGRLRWFPRGDAVAASAAAAAGAAAPSLPPAPTLPLLGEAPAAFPLPAATTIGLPLPHTDVCKFSFSTSSTSSAPSGAAFDRFLAGTCASPRPPPPAPAASPVLT